MTFLRLTSLSAAAALVLASAALAALTPRDYRAQANAACAKANAQSTALGRATTNAQFVKLMVAGLAIGRQKYTSLRALHPPSSLAVANDRALGLLRKELAFLATETKQMQAGADPLEVINTTGPKGVEMALREAAAWSAAGVAVCSSGGASIHS